MWKGEGVDEVGIDPRNGEVIIRVDPRYFRPTEVDLLIGDSSKARKTLGWAPQTSFKSLVEEMVAEDIKRAKAESNHGHSTLLSAQ